MSPFFLLPRGCDRLKAARGIGDVRCLPGPTAAQPIVGRRSAIASGNPNVTWPPGRDHDDDAFFRARRDNRFTQFPPQEQSLGDGYESDSARIQSFHDLGKIRQARAKATLPKNLALYCGRHDFGTRVLKKTGNLKLVTQTMVHIDVKTAMQYQHPELAIVRSALNDTQPGVPPVGA